MAGSVVDRLGPATLAAYAAPGFPLAAMLLPLYVVLPAYYAVDIGLGFGVVGIALLAARLWDVVTDPLIGALSDRIATRFGRRRPWMVAGAATTAPAAWALFIPPADIGVVWLLGWSAVLYFGATMVLLPYYAWGAELSPDYDERSRIAGVREGSIVLGTICAASLPILLNNDRGAVLAVLTGVVVVLLPLFVAVACAGVAEPPVPRTRSPGIGGPWRALARNRPFRLLLGAYLLNGIANGLPATLFVVFISYVLQVDDWGPYLLVYFLCGIAAVPLWIRLAGRYGKHRVWSGAMLAACAIFVWVPLLGPGDAAWFYAICVGTGLCLGADLTLPSSMQADVVDYDRARSGHVRTGHYFALWGIATKSALALAVGIAFPLLEGVGFDTDAPSPTTLLWLAGLYSLAPVAFKLAAIALMAHYPITRSVQERLRAMIARREAAVYPP